MIQYFKNKEVKIAKDSEKETEKEKKKETEKIRKKRRRKQHVWLKSKYDVKTLAIKEKL